MTTTPATIVAGTSPSATALNTHTSAITELQNPAAAMLLQGTPQPIPNSTVTAITFGSEPVDTVGGHSLSTNVDRYTVQPGYSGLYRISGQVVFSGGSSVGVRYALIYVNGLAVTGSQGGAGVVTTGTTYAKTPEVLVQLAEGDYVQLRAQQTSGSAIDTYSVDASRTSLTLQRIGG